MITSHEAAWSVAYYAGVDDDLADMPPAIAARMLKLLDMMQEFGGNLGMPHTRALGDGLFELRAKAKDGIGRGLFCYASGKQMVILCVFVKKSDKLPKHYLDLAKARKTEIENG
jgi:phage-related protein